jgi:hypothetical protein
MGAIRNACTILVEKHLGIRPLGRPRRDREDGNKMELREIRTLRIEG